MTRVLFLINEKEEDLFAYFPNLKADHDGNRTSYSHIGQHSVCSLAYVNDCIEAKHYQYFGLLRELYAIGYKNLKVLNSERLKYWRFPTQEEIQLGNGDIYYRDFSITEVGVNREGRIKSWFKCKDDGLRYNNY